MSELLGDQAFRAYLEFEERAELIRSYQPAVVPGLLQTRGYARALLAGYSDPGQRLERRMARQAKVLGERLAAGLTRCEFIVQEEALKRPAGDAAVMTEQYQRLDLTSRFAWVSLKVLPTAAGPHRGLAGAFSLLTAGGLPALYTEGLWTDTFAAGDGAAGPGERLWAGLDAMAVPWQAARGEGLA